MRRAAAAFVGRHDFASFQARGSSTLDTVRTIERLDVEERGDEVVVEIEGDGFLRHMVRAIVGTLVEVGSGLRGADTVPAILARATPTGRRPDGAGARAHADSGPLLTLLRSCPDSMALADMLAAVPQGSVEDALVRRVDFGRLPRHVAIIMDGNGRWAATRHLAARRRSPCRHRGRPILGRDLRAARHFRAHAVRVLGRELEASGLRDRRADGPAETLSAP